MTPLTPCSQCKYLGVIIATIRLKMEPPLGREGHQSQPDATHNSKKCACASKITREVIVKPHYE